MWHVFRHAHVPFCLDKTLCHFFQPRGISLPRPGCFYGLRFFLQYFLHNVDKNYIFGGYFDSWPTPASGHHRSNRPEAIKGHRHKKTRATDSMPPGDINDFCWRNRRLPSLNVNNIRQPDLVPSEPDKAPHPMMAPEQI